MDKSDYGVHATHCCAVHGCKYGDRGCPVVSGEIRQEYACEDCRPGIFPGERRVVGVDSDEFDQILNETRHHLVMPACEIVVGDILVITDTTQGRRAIRQVMCLDRLAGFESIIVGFE